jgi:hypothetical protein
MIQTGEADVLSEKPAPCHSGHNRFHMHRPEIKSRERDSTVSKM